MARSRPENRKMIKGWNEMNGKWVGKMGVPRAKLSGKRGEVKDTAVKRDKIKI